MSSSVEQIKDRLSIAEVVGAYIKLEKAGSNLKAKCPFHNEKTPSFFVSPSRGSYYCFGCNAKGDIFSFVEAFEGVDFLGALKILASKAGIALERENFKAKSERDRLFQAMDTAAFFFEGELWKSPQALNYLKKRGLLEKTIKEWRLGFAPNEWRSLFDFMSRKGFSEKELMKAGLAKESAGRFYDAFRGRIMFPIEDVSGRIIAFSGRILPEYDDKKSGKYINSPETELFNKSSVLYGMSRAKASIRSRDYAILVEGQMDLLMCHQAGFLNTAASSGTAMTPRHIDLLKRFSDNIIMSFDADKAGFKASERAFKLALQNGMSVKAVEIEGGKDPADLILSDPKEWARAVKESKHIVDFYLDRLMKSGLSGRKLVSEVKDKVLPFVKAVPSSSLQSRLVGDIAGKAGIREEAIWEDLRGIKEEENLDNRGSPAGSSRGEGSPSRENQLWRKIFGIIYWLEGKKEDGQISFLKGRLEGIAGDSLKEREKSYINIREALIFESEAAYDGSENLEEEFLEILRRIEEQVLREKLEEAMNALYKAEKDKDAKRSEELIKRCQEISRKINEIKEKR